MNTAFEPALILTLRMDQHSQAYFDGLRQLHFPPERNFLQAHLTLLHKLPELPVVFERLSAFQFREFEMRVSCLMNLGAGVAFRLEASELSTLHKQLQVLFRDVLCAQDLHGFRGHVTVQNKTSPQSARDLIKILSPDFNPFVAQALGLDLWHYLGGPWAHAAYYPFNLSII